MNLNDNYYTLTIMIKKKIKSREDLGKICVDLRKKGKTIGFTSGSFDLLHAGHADYLEKAKDMCDVLIVGVNSDQSVRQYKGENRPVMSEQQRIKLVAALETVDYVFLFNERRNNKNIEALKPDYYIKAGDYKKQSLTSSDLVEKFGGKVRLIPVEEQVSTSAIIDKIAKTGSGENWIKEEGAVHLERRPVKQSPAVFLDRDGTINEEILYLHDPAEYKLCHNAVKGVQKFQDMGYRIIIISNQPGIGMGYYSKQDFYAVNRKMLQIFSDADILVDKIYFCPHSKSEKCDCRKPNQALVQRAREELNVDLKKSIFIGDKTSDMETGKRAGMTTILMKTGFKGEDGEYPGKPDYHAKDLLDAAEWVLKKERG